MVTSSLLLRALSPMLHMGRPTPAFVMTMPPIQSVAASSIGLLCQRAPIHSTRMQLDDGMGYGASDYEPSEKQVRYAQQLAQRAGVPLPEEALVDRERCSIFIDEALSKCAPSSKQVAFAESLAMAKGEPLPDDARASAKACSEYICTAGHVCKK